MGVKLLQKLHQNLLEDGGSINVLVLDQFAFLSPGIEQGFMASVFPVVSSSKTSQVIIVSTPNGMSNQYYRIWNKAMLNKNNPDVNANDSWYPIKIDWWQVPGRDEKWKQMQLATFNGNQQRFLQEFGNSFLGSVATLISGARIKQFKSFFQNEQNIKECYKLQLHQAFPQTNINMYLPPQRNRAYIIGADASTGTDSDYQAMTVWDVTNTFNIQLVASFYENNVSPKVFAYILAKTASLYNKAFIACENNGVSHTTIDYLWKQFEYENVIHYGGNPKTTIGIHSSGTLKFDACLNLKEIFENQLRNIIINDGRLIEEMERFQKKNRPGRAPTYMAVQGHDDLMLSAVWAFYFLKPNLIEKYFEVRQYVSDKLNQEIPLFLTSIESVDLSYNNDTTKFIEELDKKFKATTKIYNIPIQQLEQNVKQQQKRLMSEFKLVSNNSQEEQADSNKNFQFSGFFN